MKYYISNGNSYILFIKNTTDNKTSYSLTDKIGDATVFKTYESAKIYMSLCGLTNGNYCVQKYWLTKKSGTKFYVVTNCTNYVSVSKKKNLTPKYGGHRWFNTLDSAMQYIRNNKPFDDCHVFDENCNCVDTSAYAERKFTPQQKAILGVDNDWKKHKRIVIRNDVRNIIYRKAKGKCQICGRPLDVDGKWSVDHIVPLSRGGENVIDNYQAVCRSCNRIKDALKEDEFKESIKKIYLYSVKQQKSIG